MLNVYTQLLALLPADPLQAGTVTTTHTDGTATVTLTGGGTLRVINGVDAPQGVRVFVKSGAIQGTAPNLPTGTIDV
jgi:hypothetical protein